MKRIPTLSALVLCPWVLRTLSDESDGLIKSALKRVLYSQCPPERVVEAFETSGWGAAETMTPLTDEAKSAIDKAAGAPQKGTAAGAELGDFAVDVFGPTVRDSVGVIEERYA